MFAYCRNNPVSRIDISGTADAACYDNDPLDEEDLLKDSQGGGTAHTPCIGSQENNGSSGNSNKASSCVPQHAKNVLNYVKANNGEPPPGYKGGKPYANDGRNGTQILPEDAPYYEYDVHPFSPGVNRGTERIVIGSSGTAWYTFDHYISFIRME